MPRRDPGLQDALILGSGAGGGPLALALSQAGLDVLVLEKGPRHRREDYPADEIEQARRRPFVPRLEDDPHTVVTPRTTTPIPTELGWIAVCLGGGTVHMGSYLYRFHPEDFQLRSRLGPYEEVADWPFGYGELEPYYARAEREVGVAGLGGANPFEGACRSRASTWTCRLTTGPREAGSSRGPARSSATSAPKTSRP